MVCAYQLHLVSETTHSRKATTVLEYLNAFSSTLYGLIYGTYRVSVRDPYPGAYLHLHHSLPQLHHTDQAKSVQHTQRIEGTGS